MRRAEPPALLTITNPERWWSRLNLLSEKEILLVLLMQVCVLSLLIVRPPTWKLQFFSSRPSASLCVCSSKFLGQHQSVMQLIICDASKHWLSLSLHGITAFHFFLGDRFDLHFFPGVDDATEERGLCCLVASVMEKWLGTLSSKLQKKKCKNTFFQTQFHPMTFSSNKNHMWDIRPCLCALKPKP